MMRRLNLRATMAVALMGFAVNTARADDWPQWLGPQRDGVWRETGLVEKFPAGGPKVRWRTPIGEGYSGPAVAAGSRVHHRPRARRRRQEPRQSHSQRSARRRQGTRACASTRPPARNCGSTSTIAPTPISYAAGPRTTPVVAGDKVYTLGAMGHLFCFDVKTGNVVWSKNLPKEYKFEVPLGASPAIRSSTAIG